MCFFFVFFFVFFFHFFISVKYDFHVSAERKIVKTRETLRNICVDCLKIVWHDTSSEEKIADIRRLRSTKLIFVGYGKLNSTTVLDFCTVYV